MLCDWLETAGELYSISELQEIMIELAGHVDVYSERHLQRMLLEKYKDEIVLSQVAGKNNVLCFKNTASRILSDRWYSERQSNIDDESQRIVVAAAKLIKAQIRDSK